MATDALTSLSTLYDEDETAWLEAMAQLVAERQCEALDYDHLSEYLIDMARRDRREVRSRLVVLLTHLLKWECQPEKQSASWRATIRAQRRELREDLESGTLRRHAEAVLAKAYEDARYQAADETELPVETFPSVCKFTVEELLSKEIDLNRDL